MASLRDTVKDYQEELRDGIAWVAFWKTGRSWNAKDFHLELGDYLYPEDRSRMEERRARAAAMAARLDSLACHIISRQLNHYTTRITRIIASNRV